MSERVLVLPRNAVPDGCDFVGIRRFGETDLDRLRDAVAQWGRWMERATAEHDASYKQIIPYTVVRDGDRIFLMERTEAGGDMRLHHKVTIGVGGHLNPVDDGPDTLSAGLQREWREEIAAEWEPEFVAIGLLNDDRNPVGSVHLGVVFEVEAAGRALDVRERDKLSGRIVTLAELHAVWDRMESWSQLVAAAIWGEPGR